LSAKVTRIQKESFLWIDLCEPTKKVLTEVATELSLPSQTLKDCLNPEHLPKYERFGETSFIITRIYDDKCTEDADTAQELTRKIAIFWGPQFFSMNCY
jgi:magnesium transporter